MEYILKRKRIKNMYARLDKDNNLVITAPYLVSLKTIEKFAVESYEKLSKRKEKKSNKSIFNNNGEVKILGKYEYIENLSDLNAILLKNLKDYLNRNYMNIVNMMGISDVPNVKIKKVKFFSNR